MKLRFGLFAVTLGIPLVVAAACSDPHRPPMLGDPPPSTTSTGIPRVGAEGGPSADAAPPGDGGTCGALPLFGVDVTEEFVPTDPPSPVGGALVFGVYRLFAAQDYTGFGGQSG